MSPITVKFDGTPFDESDIGQSVAGKVVVSHNIEGGERVNVPVSATIADASVPLSVSITNVMSSVANTWLVPLAAGLALILGSIWIARRRSMNE